jgi:predicted AlkP superfamily pyrophosphatase or phosphodiesterase
MRIVSSFNSTLSRVKRRAAVAVAFLSLAALSVAVIVASHAQIEPQETQAKARRVLVISLDGLDARYLSKSDEYGLKIPTLRRLMAEGQSAEGVISVYPSVTYPAHTTLVTGAHPARHGIFGNELFEPKDTVPLTRAEWYWFARYIQADTLWDAAARAGLSTAMVSWPVSGGAGDYNVPEILKFGAPLQDTLALMKMNQRPQGLIEGLEKRDPSLYRNATKDETDDMRTRFAEHIIWSKRPHVMLVHLFDLDHFQHDYGPFTKESFAMLEKVDGYVERLLAAAKRAETLNETAVFIVSDHGFKSVSKLFHAGVLLERAGLLKVREEKDAQGNARSVVTDWRALPYPTAGSCAIILRDPADRETLKKLREIFKPLLKQKGSGIFHVLEGKEIRALGANPRAALMLEANEGYSFGSNYTGDPVTENKQRGQHGYLPTRVNYYASFIASGAGVHKRNNLGIVRMIDIGPTIARTLGLELRNAEGQPLK